MSEAKSIDLGKLQDEQRKAHRLLVSANLSHQLARANTAKALAHEEKARNKHAEAEKALDAAKRAVIEGARAVANGG